MKNNIFTFPGHESLMVKSGEGFEKYSNFVNPIFDNVIIGPDGPPVYLPPTFPDWNTMTCDDISALVAKYRIIVADFNTPYPHIALYNDQISLATSIWQKKCGQEEPPIKIDPPALPVLPVFPDFNTMTCDALKAEIKSYTDLINTGKMNTAVVSAYNTGISNATSIYNKKCGATTTSGSGGVLPAFLGGFGGGSGGGGSTAVDTKKKFNWWWVVAGAVVVYIATSGKEKKAA